MFSWCRTSRYPGIAPHLGTQQQAINESKIREMLTVQFGEHACCSHSVVDDEEHIREVVSSVLMMAK